MTANTPNALGWKFCDHGATRIVYAWPTEDEFANFETEADRDRWFATNGLTLITDPAGKCVEIKGPAAAKNPLIPFAVLAWIINR